MDKDEKLQNLLFKHPTFRASLIGRLHPSTNEFFANDTIWQNNRYPIPHLFISAEIVKLHI